MASLLLSDAEKIYTLHGIEENLRVDGRKRDDYRPIELETGILPQTMGSSRLRLANTDILASVIVDLAQPFSDKPDEGIIEFFVDCSANATPAFEGRGGEHLATEITNSLTTAYKSNQAFNLSSLCVISNRICLKVNVDILILECGGNLFDAVSLAVKSAIFNTRIPSVTATILDGGETDVQISDNPKEFRRFLVNDIPIMVTLSKIGEHCIVDPSSTEEACSSASLVIGVSSNDRYCSIIKQGSGSFHPITLLDSLEFGKTIALSLNQSLMNVLNREEQISNKPIVGFLK